MACPAVVNLDSGRSCLRDPEIRKENKVVRFPNKSNIKEEYEPKYFIREDLDLLPTDLLQSPSKPDNSRKIDIPWGENPSEATHSSHRCFSTANDKEVALMLAIRNGRELAENQGYRKQQASSAYSRWKEEWPVLQRDGVTITFPPVANHKKKNTPLHCTDLKVNRIWTWERVKSIVQMSLNHEGSDKGELKALEQVGIRPPAVPCAPTADPVIDPPRFQEPIGYDLDDPSVVPSKRDVRRSRRADREKLRLAASFNEAARGRCECCPADATDECETSVATRNAADDRGTEDCNLDYESQPMFDQARYDDEIIKTSSPPSNFSSPDSASSKPIIKTVASNRKDKTHNPTRTKDKNDHTALSSTTAVSAPPDSATVSDPPDSVPRAKAKSAPPDLPSSTATPNSTASPKGSLPKSKRKPKTKAEEASPSCPTTDTDVSTDAGTESAVETGCDSSSSNELSDSPLEDRAHELCVSDDDSWMDESSGASGPSKRARLRAKQEKIKGVRTTIKNNVRALAAAMVGKRSKYPCPEIKEWLMDTGSGHDLIDAATAAKFRKWIRQASKTFKLQTAGGIRKVDEEIPFHVAHLGDNAAALILPSTPAVLTIGRRCVEEGYHFEWPAFSSSPFMIAPDGKLIRLFVRGYVPYVRKDSFTGEYVELDRDKAKAVPAPSVDSAKRTRRTGKGAPTAADNLDANILGVDNQIASNDPRDMAKNHDHFGDVVPGGSDADDEEQDSSAKSRTRKKQEALKAEAKSIRHLMCHFPKNPYCPICRDGKCMRPPRRKGGLKRSTRKIKKFGDLVTCDHIVCRGLASQGVTGEKDCVMIYDKATNWLHAGPVKSKAARHAYDQFIQFAGDEKIRRVYSDGSKELKLCCKAHKIPQDISDPGLPEDNGLAESMVRVEVEGTRCALLQAGMPPCFWPLGMTHFVFSRNIAITNDTSSYDKRFQEGHFPGKVIPFGAYVTFQELPHVEKDTKKPKFAPRPVPGVFLGYVQRPGGRWAGRYIVANLKEFVNMDLRVGGPIRTQEVQTILGWDPKELTFPLKEFHDLANNTLQGLSMPYRVDPKTVQPQGIESFSLPPSVKKKMVGDSIADSEFEEKPQLPGVLDSLVGRKGWFKILGRHPVLVSPDAKSFRVCTPKHPAKDHPFRTSWARVGGEWGKLEDNIRWCSLENKEALIGPDCEVLITVFSDKALNLDPPPVTPESLQAETPFMTIGQTTAEISTPTARNEVISEPHPVDLEEVITDPGGHKTPVPAQAGGTPVPQTPMSGLMTPIPAPATPTSGLITPVSAADGASTPRPAGSTAASSEPRRSVFKIRTLGATHFVTKPENGPPWSAVLRRFTMDLATNKMIENKWKEELKGIEHSAIEGGPKDILTTFWYDADKWSPSDPPHVPSDDAASDVPVEVADLIRAKYGPEIIRYDGKRMPASNLVRQVDVRSVPGGTTVDGEFVRKKAGSNRCPDVTSTVWNASISQPERSCARPTISPVARGPTSTHGEKSKRRFGN